MWSSQSKEQSPTYLITKEDETKTWNKKLDHLNLISMRNIIVEKDNSGLPNLKMEEGNLFGDCKIGK